MGHEVFAHSFEITVLMWIGRAVSELLEFHPRGAAGYSRLLPSFFTIRLWLTKEMNSADDELG